MSDKENLPLIIPFRQSTSLSILSCVTFAYRCVVVIYRCPMILLTVSIGIPCDKQIILPKVCRKKWNKIGKQSTGNEKKG